MGWDARRSSTFQPAGAAPPIRFSRTLLLPYSGDSFHALSAQLLHLLRLLARFTHRTVFCRWDNDVFILHTTRRPVPLNCAAPPGERPRAQPVIAAGFEPACRYHPGGSGNTDPGSTGPAGTGNPRSGRPGTGDPPPPPQLRRISLITRLA